MDIGLPDLNGFEFAKRARSMDISVPLIALTGYGQQADRDKVQKAGFDLHLVKPIQPQQVALSINELLCSARRRISSVN